MKNFALMVLAAASLASSGAWAQTSQAPQQTNANDTQISREQVYQELAAARNDGSLDRVNKLYAHR